MCGLSIFGCLSFIPYLTIILMPIFGSFYGKEPVLRLSLYLIGQSLLTSVTSRFLLLAEPLVQIAVLVCLFSLRVTLVPTPAVWLYDVALFVSEPLWQLMEAAGVVYFSMSLSQEAADRMDDKPTLAKSYILTVSGACYIFTLCLLWNIINTDSVFYIWSAIILSVCIIGIHVLAVSHESGVISDAATVGFCSMAFLYDICHSYDSTYRPGTIPENWASYGSDHSYVQMFIQLLSGSGHAWHTLTQMMSPWFLATLIVRICCVLFTVAVTKTLLNKVTEWSEEHTTIQSYDSDEEEEDDFDDLDLPVTFKMTRSPLLIKLVVIFVLTQFLVCHMHHTLYEDTSWLSWLQRLFPSGRWIQIILLNVFYIYRLYGSSDDKNESFW